MEANDSEQQPLQLFHGTDAPSRGASLTHAPPSRSVTNGGDGGQNNLRGDRGNVRRGGHGRRVGRGTKKAMVQANDLPNYDDEVVEDGNGNAILPCNFLPGIVDNLPEEWFYRTYKFFPYFDLTQRDGNGNISVPTELADAVPDNVSKWKACVKLLGDHNFKEIGKMEYGLEIGRMAAADGYNIGLTPSRARTGGLDAACSSAMAMKFLFRNIAPELMKDNRITELIAIAYNWMYVPTLEGNNKWLLQGIANYFRTKSAKVVLSTDVIGHKRQHSVMQIFKKYATQSHLGNFRKKQKKEWKFIMEVSCSRDKRGRLPPCNDGETWTDHDISSHVSEKFKNMMCRHGKYNILVRHFGSGLTVDNVFANELRLTVQRAMTNGCPLHQLIRLLDAEKKSATEKFCSSLTIGGLSSEQMYPDPLCPDDYNQLNGELQGGSLIDQISLPDWDNECASFNHSSVLHDGRQARAAQHSSLPTSLALIPPASTETSHTTPASAIHPPPPKESSADHAPPPAPLEVIDKHPTPSADPSPPPAPANGIPPAEATPPAPAKPSHAPQAAPLKVTDKTPTPSAVAPSPSAPAKVTPPAPAKPSHTPTAPTLHPPPPPASMPALSPPPSSVSMPDQTSPIQAPAPEKATAPPAEPRHDAAHQSVLLHDAAHQSVLLPVQGPKKVPQQVRPHSPELDHTTPGIGALDIPSVPKMMPDATRTQGTRSIGRINQLTDGQKSASEHITQMQDCQRDAFLLLERMKSSHADMCKDYGRKYIPDYIGLGKCHLRALSNVNTQAAAEVHRLGVGHRETDRVLDVFKKYQDRSNGKIFHIRKQHWVAVQKCPESDGGVFYDEMVLMGITDYESAIVSLELLQNLSALDYGKVFRSPVNKAFSNTMKKLQAKVNTNRGDKRKADGYGLRSGMSLVKQYGRKKGKRKFVIWHCRDAFENKNQCVDGVCGECKIKHNNNGHRCRVCKESIVDYKDETNQDYMPRKRPKWEGPGPEKCAICDITL